MNISQDVSFIELVDKAKSIKRQYIGLLSAFSIYEMHEKNKAICDTKRKIYQLNIKNYQADKIWEYLNGDITYIELELLRNLK